MDNLGSLFPWITALRKWDSADELPFRPIFLFDLPSARIVKPAPEHRVHVQIDENQLFLELLSSMDEVPRLIEDEALSVKNELILPAHLAHGGVSARGRTGGDGGGGTRRGAGPLLHLPRLIAGAWRRLQTRFTSRLEWFIRKVYRPSLRFGLEWRYLTVAAGVTVFALTDVRTRGKIIAVGTLAALAAGLTSLATGLVAGQALTYVLAHAAAAAGAAVAAGFFVQGILHCRGDLQPLNLAAWLLFSLHLRSPTRRRDDPG